MDVVVSKFWMVLSDVPHPCVVPTPASPPTYRHSTEAIAKKEAARLANANPGIKFFVLEVVAACVKSDVQWMEVEKMPF